MLHSAQAAQAHVRGRAGTRGVEAVRCASSAPPAPLSPASAASPASRIVSAFKAQFKSLPVSRVLAGFERAVSDEPPFAAHGPLGQQHASSFVADLPPATPFHEADAFPWAATLEAGAESIAAELAAFAAAPAGVAKPAVWSVAARAEAVAYGPQWRTLVLQDRGRWHEEHAAAFPRTVALVKAAGVPCVECFFARQGPGSGIAPHSGAIPCFSSTFPRAVLSLAQSTTRAVRVADVFSSLPDQINFILTAHLGLSVPEGQCRITVGLQTREWRNGRVLVMDTSFVHHTANDAQTEERVILLLRFWHPGLSRVECVAEQWLFDVLDDDTPAGVAAAGRAADREILRISKASVASKGFGKRCATRRKQRAPGHCPDAPSSAARERSIFHNRFSSLHRSTLPMQSQSWAAQCKSQCKRLRWFKRHESFVVYNLITADAARSMSISAMLPSQSGEITCWATTTGGAEARSTFGENIGEDFLSFLGYSCWNPSQNVTANSFSLLSFVSLAMAAAEQCGPAASKCDEGGRRAGLPWTARMAGLRPSRSLRGVALDRHRFACARRDGLGCVLFPTDAQEFSPGDDEQTACFELVTHGGGALGVRGPSCLTPKNRDELKRHGPSLRAALAGKQLMVRFVGWRKEVCDAYASGTRAFFSGTTLDERDALTHVSHAGHGVGFGLFSTSALGPRTVFAEYVGLGCTDKEAKDAAAARGAVSEYAFDACGLGFCAGVGYQRATKLVLDGAVWVGGERVRRRLYRNPWIVRNLSHERNWRAHHFTKRVCAAGRANSPYNGHGAVNCVCFDVVCAGVAGCGGPAELPHFHVMLATLPDSGLSKGEEIVLEYGGRSTASCQRRRAPRRARAHSTRPEAACRRRTRAKGRRRQLPTRRIITHSHRLAMAML